MKIRKARHLAIIRLEPQSIEHPDMRSFAGTIPTELRHSWNLLVARVPFPAGAVCRIRLGGRLHGSFNGREGFPVGVPWGRRSSLRFITGFVNAGDDTALIELFGDPGQNSQPIVLALHIHRIAAAILVFLARPARLFGALRGGYRQAFRHMRTVMAVTAMSSSRWPPYATWIEHFDKCPRDSLKDQLLASTKMNLPRVAAIVFRQASGGQDALAATISSLETSWLHTDYHIAGGTLSELRDMADDLAKSRIEYVAILQAGEIVPTHALAAVSATIKRLGEPPILCADEDELDEQGQRRRPLFKPQANRMLMLSGILTRGLWVFRRDILSLVTEETCRWAEALRLDLLLKVQEREPQTKAHHLPFVLAHRRRDTEQAPPDALAGVVRNHLSRTGFGAQVQSGQFPLVVIPDPDPAALQKISMIVPSSLRSPQSAKCLAEVLTRTDYPDFDLLLVVSQPQPPDPDQLQLVRTVLSDRRVRLLHMQTDSFNYAAVNNFAVRNSGAGLVCLLNDDVAPINRDWLRLMAGHLADPTVGVVGAKLYYPNQTVQHAGIIMGLNGICEHAWRFLPRGEGGYAGRANLDQEMSAVTGACLVTRRSVFDEVGGLDEGFPISFNDVDFCLQARARGHGVVLSAHSELFHYESLSLKRHYSARGEAEILRDKQRFLGRWGDPGSEDPFHNPNLAQQAGNEWQPAFPPRVNLDSFGP